MTKNLSLGYGAVISVLKVWTSRTLQRFGQLALYCAFHNEAKQSHVTSCFAPITPCLSLVLHSCFRVSPMAITI